MREFAADRDAHVHPQTVIEHFGTWNAAKRAAGLQPRRFISREELLDQLRELGEELGVRRRRATSRRAAGGWRRSRLIWHTFGSLSAALREAGFDVPVGEERLERAVAHGAFLARRLGRLPKMADWKQARSDDSSLPSEWQVYRMVDRQPGCLVGLPVPRPRAPPRGGRPGAARRQSRPAVTSMQPRYSSRSAA